MYKPGVSGLIGVYKDVRRKAMDGHVTDARRLDALYEAMRLVVEEFADTKDAEVAAAGHVIAQLFIKRIKAMDEGMDRQDGKAAM